MSELLPCPFCGGEAKVAIGQGQNDGHGYIVFCDMCWVSQSYLDKTEAEAIEAWNTRAERTCHRDEYEAAPFSVCSECGAVLPDDCTVYYCWSCGAKVIGGE